MPLVPDGNPVALAVADVDARNPSLLQQRASDAMVLPPALVRHVAHLAHRDPSQQVVRVLYDEGIAEAAERVPHQVERILVDDIVVRRRVEHLHDDPVGRHLGPLHLAEDLPDVVPPVLCAPQLEKGRVVSPKRLRGGELGLQGGVGHHHCRECARVGRVVLRAA
eukprot:5596096-Pyramimonas_sp.AAC.1